MHSLNSRELEDARWNKIMSKTGVLLHENSYLPGLYYSTTDRDKEEDKKEKYHFHDLEDDEEEADENDLYEIINVSNDKEKDNADQGDKDEDEVDNESNHTDQESIIIIIGMIEDTDPESEQL
jgi:alpha-galactosidase/6-phospho-beta-glucosidase family protein